MAEFSFGLSEGSFLQLNNIQKQLPTAKSIWGQQQKTW